MWGGRSVSWQQISHECITVGVYYSRTTHMHTYSTLKFIPGVHPHSTVPHYCFLDSFLAYLIKTLTDHLSKIHLDRSKKRKQKSKMLLFTWQSSFILTCTTPRSYNDTDKSHPLRKCSVLSILLSSSCILIVNYIFTGNAETYALM